MEGNIINLDDYDVAAREVPLEIRKMFKWSIYTNEETGEIIIGPGHDGLITLLGADEIELFIESIRNHIQR